MRVTCHLVGVVQMVRANPDRNFALGIFAYHLNRPSTNRFSHVNGKQPQSPFYFVLGLIQEARRNALFRFETTYNVISVFVVR